MRGESRVALLAGIEEYGQALRAAERLAHDLGHRHRRVEPQVRQPVQHRIDTDLQLESRQVDAETEVAPLAETQVRLLGVAVEIEAIAVLVARFVAIGRGGNEMD